MNRLRQYWKLQKKCNHIRSKRKNLFGSNVYCSRFTFWQVNILGKIIVISKLFLNKSILGNGQLVDGSTVPYITIGQLCLQLVEITKPLLKFMVVTRINLFSLFTISTLLLLYLLLIDPCTKNMTQVNWNFLLMKSSKKYSIFLPAFYPIMLLMISPKNFEKIAILKIWRLFSSELSKLTSANYPWNKAFSGMTKIDFHQYCPRNSYCAH